MPTLIKTTEEPRRYLLDGVELPGVTDILTDAGHIDKSRYESFSNNGYFRDRGTFVHEACDLVDRGTEIAAASLEGYRGYVSAYVDARVLLPTPVAIEQSLYHETLCYAGTIDRIYPFAIGDLKTAKQTAVWWRLQLAAYAILVGPPYRELFDLQLREDGSHRIVHVTHEQYCIAAFQFLSALMNYHRRNKLPAKQLNALVLAAVSIMSAIYREYGNSTEEVRCGNEAHLVLAGGQQHEAAGRQGDPDREGRGDHVVDEGEPAGRGEDAAGEGRRAA